LKTELSNTKLILYNKYSFHSVFKSNFSINLRFDKNFSVYKIPETYKNCRICPRNCGIDRTENRLGYCKTDDKCRVSSVCVHRGEEPVVGGSRGICNVFFNRCNLRCAFCQNYEISQCSAIIENEFGFDETIEMISEILDTGIEAVGFVSPSHVVPVVRQIIENLKEKAYSPTFVYNSGGYDSVESLKTLEGLIDVYLPDFKYSDSMLAKSFSDAPDYPEIALRAVREMYRQIGSSVVVNDDGRAERGLIIRHLVLPGCTENTRGVMKMIADEISPNLHISLMSQYYPTDAVMQHHVLKRNITQEEYQLAISAMEEAGLHRGWIQEMSSAETYRPDFSKKLPFE
jgi:putative pyruvate formate lyase activating enzyme